MTLNEPANLRSSIKILYFMHLTFVQGVAFKVVDNIAVGTNFANIESHISSAETIIDKDKEQVKIRINQILS